MNQMGNDSVLSDSGKMHESHNDITKLKVVLASAFVLLILIGNICPSAGSF